MKRIKSFKKFTESMQIDVSLIKIDINESLSVSFDDIMKSISAREINLFDEREIEDKLFLQKIKELSETINIEDFSNNSDISDSITISDFKLSPVQKTGEYETYVRKPFSFLLIYKDDELKPDYIITQSKNELLDKWENIRVYRIEGDFNKFYDSLSMKKIKIEYNGKEYIYGSTNKNEWELEAGKSSKIFKKYLRKDELEKIINDNKVTLNVI